MSEFWVSQKRYWCKYCAVWIADNKAQRTQHETGLKHKGNKERFIRNVERREKHNQIEEEKTKRMLEKMEKDAAAQFAADLALHKSLNPSPPPDDAPKPFHRGPRLAPPNPHETEAAKRLKTRYDVKYDLKDYGIGPSDTSNLTLEELRGEGAGLGYPRIPYGRPEGSGQYGLDADGNAVAQPPPIPEDPLGPWVVVESSQNTGGVGMGGGNGRAKKEQVQYGLAADLVAAEAEEEQDGDYRNFKVREKVLEAEAENPDGGDADSKASIGEAFRKRRVAGGGGRNVRRRTEES
ncbi:hypothetical protein HDU93_002288 [Gonapodya sp. JEL0774]|nr:hypothetical protein HDU93_002288 [Gonapodya sp. JEL0774]